MPLRAVLFDLDGTLLDTLTDLAAAGNHTLVALGFAPHAQEDYKRMVGNGVAKLVERFLPEQHRGIATQALALDIFSRFYGEHMFDHTIPYPGMPQVLAQLKERKVRLGVVSNKADQFTAETVDRFFPGIFDTVIGQRENIPPKPDPAMVYTAMAALAATTGNSIFCGDSEVDVQTARAAGLPCCGVAWGFRSEEELLAAGAVYVVKTSEEMIACFDAMRP